MLYGQVNVPAEFALTAALSYSDISNEVEVDVVFTHPDGEERKVPAFWAGGGVFRVRFAAPRPGRYRYRSVCTRADDAGLHGRLGELEIAPYAGGHALYEHGRLRVAETGRTLEHADGTPFFWLADTWWMGLTSRLNWPDGFRGLLLDRARKGFSAVQIVAGPLPDFCATTATWHPQQANEAGWPWQPRFARINPAFYDLADLRIACLVEQGLVPCIVGMWGYYLPFMGVDKVRKHWRNLVARYSAYPVVWCVAGEQTMPTYAYFADPGKRDESAAEQKKGWTEVTRYLRDLDAFDNLITTHPGYASGSRDQVDDPSLLDVEMLQTGHSGYFSLATSVELTVAACARRPRIPVFIGEVNYEHIMGGSLQDVQRFQFWASVTSGACGFTYGAQGIWAMSSRDEPFEGTTLSWGDGFWQDAMHYAGSAQVGLGRRFFERYPWWRFEPRVEPAAAEAGRDHAFACGIPGAVAVCYIPACCMDGRLQGLRDGRLAIEPGASYAAHFFNPRTGGAVPAGAVVPDANGRWPVPPTPTREDWLLVLENAPALKEIRAGCAASRHR